MNRKPRFKVQRLNSGDVYDSARYGNKRWLNSVIDDEGRHGFTMTFEQATALYWKLAGRYSPESTYRIVEKR